MTADAAADGRAGTSAAISAEAGEAGLRLDRMLALHLPALSRTRLKRLIEEGHVIHAGAASRDPSLRVRPGQNFVVFFPEAEDAAPTGQPIALDIRFEDAHLVVIDKPAGLVVHPAPGNPDGTLVNALIAHCGASLAGIGGVRRPGIVHRLDKDTSGLMVVAKTEGAHRALSRDFALRRIDRAYAAFVWGVPAPATGEIAGNIGRSPANRKKMAVVGEGRGRPALTRYRVERAFEPRQRSSNAASPPGAPIRSGFTLPIGTPVDRRPGLWDRAPVAPPPGRAMSARGSPPFPGRRFTPGGSASRTRRAETGSSSTARCRPTFTHW